MLITLCSLPCAFSPHLFISLSHHPFIPSSLTPHPSPLISHPSPLIPYPSPPIPHLSSLIPTPFVLFALCSTLYALSSMLSRIQHPASSTQHPASSTQHPAPSTQHLHPFIASSLHRSAPLALRSTRYALPSRTQHPAPSTFIPLSPPRPLASSFIRQPPVAPTFFHIIPSSQIPLCPSLYALRSAFSHPAPSTQHLHPFIASSPSRFIASSLHRFIVLLPPSIPLPQHASGGLSPHCIPRPGKGSSAGRRRYPADPFLPGSHIS